MGRNPNPSRTQPQAFFKVMFGDFSNHLLIPPAFSKHIDGVFPQEFVLRTRDGTEKRVSVIKVKNELIFEAGWSSFVQDKSLELGDFLVFNNGGDFEFNVSIYKRRTGCEEKFTVSEKERNLIENDPDCTSDEFDKFKQSRAKLSEAMRGKAGAIEAANKFKSKLPFFKKTMTFSYINQNYLHIPATFVNKYLVKKVQFIKLQVTNRSWPVKISGPGRFRAARLSTGWADFVKDNTLQEEDVCVFELNKRNGIVLKVSIYKRRTGCEEEVTAAEKEKNLIVTNPDRSGDESDKFKQSCAKVPEAMCGKAGAVEAANKFNSKFPFFKVTMTSSYIMKNYLHIPATFVSKYLNKKAQFIKLRVTNRSWPVKISANGRHRVVWFSSGWHDFVKDNTLQDGDVCVFELIKRNGIVLKVSIFRCSG